MVSGFWNHFLVFELRSTNGLTHPFLACVTQQSSYMIRKEESLLASVLREMNYGSQNQHVEIGEAIRSCHGKATHHGRKLRTNVHGDALEGTAPLTNTHCLVIEASSRSASLLFSTHRSSITSI